MIYKKPRLAIIAGSGELVKNCIEECIAKKKNFIIIGIKNFYLEKKFKNYFLLNLNNIGNIFNILEQNNIKEVLFIGAVKKPKIYKLRPNFITIYYLSFIIFRYFSGDNSLLTKIYELFRIKGYKILDPRKLLKKNLADKKNNNILLFKKEKRRNDVKNYFYLSKKIGSEDTGQSVIVCNQKILLKEDTRGTDYLIKKYSNLNRNDKFVLLVKTTKPKQNLYFDLPTIGPITIKNIYKSNIKGIIIENKKTFIVRPKETFDLINKYKLFYYAY